ncbi:uncharacterized protein [Ptychodera flava]|uniref:uncharacterized protein n=1 Tax=Ptychodera flava TaxID=63121 RepID=UPI00396A2FCA
MSTTAVHTTPVPWNIVQDEDPDNTFEGDPELKYIVYQSMGFQIYQGVEKNGEVKHFVALWFRYYNNSEPEKYDIAELDFDPSEAWHSYLLQVTTDRVQNEMTLELFIDGRSLSYMVGLSPFASDPKFILSVWNAEGEVSPFDDVFRLPESTAYFRDIRFPPSADALCRFGDPFRSGDNPIAAYFAGVGSEKLLDDVVPFHEVYRPCTPCSSQCLDEVCDSECSQRDTTEYYVKMTDLALNTTRTIEEDGETESVPAVYYFTVKAVTGAGRYALASSDGIYIDDTPPVFEYLYHVDLSWSEDEPVTYQGCNSTIAVRWDVYDIGSQILECKWAIGSMPNGTDIQEFVSVGLDNYVRNDKLLGLLEDGKTYYATVWAINSAGLATVKSTSGVTMVLAPPDVTESNTTALCGDGSLPPSGLCGDQSSTGLTWSAVDDVAVDAYYYSVGSSEGIEDIFPKTQVGFNESGTVTVKDGALYVGEEPITNISDVRGTAEKREGAELEDDTVYQDRFHMEPGRTLVSRITVCTKGHLCEDMPSSKTTITRTQDYLLKVENGLKINANGVKNLHEDDDFIRAKNFDDNGGFENGESVSVGLLTHDDVIDDYVSDASTNFKPFIIDPEATTDETDRYLRRRIRDIIGPTFYVTTIGGTPLFEPFELSIEYVSSPFDNDVSDREPAILYWDSETQQWKDASHTCTESFGEYKQDKEVGILSTQVCSTREIQPCMERRRKDINQKFFSGPTEFTLAIIGPFSNSPPVFTSASNLWMWEDGGTLRYQLTAFDDDDDVITFHLDPSSPHSAESVKVSADGEFTYRPCPDCYGVDFVTVIAREDRDDDFEELSTVSTIQMDIRGVNDNPELLFSVNHKSVINNEQNEATTTTVEQRHANDDFYVGLETVVGAFDPDTSDVLALTFDPPKHGELKIGSQHTQVTFIDGDCSGPMNITDEHLSVQTPDVPIVVFPCGLVIPHHRDRLAWVFSALEYTPFVDFTGKDSFKINAIDQDGAYSQVAMIDVFVLVNPCMNGGICTGPEHDPDCSSTERTSGFDGYSCSCPPGFTGSLCETELSLCYSNPCPYNYTCVDLVRSVILL